MGSKSKLEGFLIPTLQNIINKNQISTYIEPFVGGANVIDKIKCKTKIGYDKSKTLIALLNVAKDDFDKIPLDGSREWFNKARSIYRGESNEPMEDYLIGAIQWMGSFGNRGFPGGYAPNKNGKNYYKHYRDVLEAQAPNFQDCTFQAKDFSEIEIPENALVYCDPPYQGTKTYGYAFESKFDYEKYWDWVRENSQKSFVVCSEENFPNDFIVIKEKEKRRTVGGNNKKIITEKLGIFSQGKMADSSNLY